MFLQPTPTFLMGIPSFFFLKLCIQIFILLVIKENNLSGLTRSTVSVLFVYNKYDLTCKILPKNQCGFGPGNLDRALVTPLSHFKYLYILIIA
jgi:hypothetical protein